MSSEAPTGGSQAEQRDLGGGTTAVLPRPADTRRVQPNESMINTHNTYAADFIYSSTRPDGTIVLLFIEIKQATASALSSDARTHERMTLDEFDAMLLRKGILASVPTPHPIKPRDEARLRVVPPLFRWRKSITEIIREARDHG